MKGILLAFLAVSAAAAPVPYYSRSQTANQDAGAGNANLRDITGRNRDTLSPVVGDVSCGPDQALIGATEKGGYIFGGTCASVATSTISTNISGHAALDVLKAGDTMTGNLTISKVSPNLTLNNTNTTGAEWFTLQGGPGGSLFSYLGLEGINGNNFLTGGVASATVIVPVNNGTGGVAIGYGTASRVGVYISTNGYLSVGSPASTSPLHNLQVAGDAVISSTLSALSGLFAVGPWIDITAPPYSASPSLSDNYTAIQNAITAAPEGGTVFVPCGSYSIHGALSVTKGIRILGQGPTCAQIHERDNVDTFFVSSVEGFHCENIFAVSESSGPIGATYAGTAEFHLVSTHRGSFKNCGFYGAGANGSTGDYGLWVQGGILNSFYDLHSGQYAHPAANGGHVNSIGVFLDKSPLNGDEVISAKFVNPILESDTTNFYLNGYSNTVQWSISLDGGTIESARAANLVIDSPLGSVDIGHCDIENGNTVFTGSSTIIAAAGFSMHDTFLADRLNFSGTSRSTSLKNVIVHGGHLTFGANSYHVRLEEVVISTVDLTDNSPGISVSNKWSDGSLLSGSGKIDDVGVSTTTSWTGIGVADPSSALDVNGLVTSRGLSAQDVAYQALFTSAINQSKSFRSGTSAGNGSEFLGGFDGSGNNYWQINTVLAGVASNALRGDNNNQVGVGIVPTNKLDVNGGITARGNITANVTNFDLIQSTNTSRIILDGSSDSAGAQINLWGSSAAFASASQFQAAASSYVFATNLNSADKELVIDRDKIGILTATPATALDVNGNSQFGTTSKSTFSIVGGLFIASGSSITLTGANGFITGSSSFTGGAFFGDGSHLTGIPSTNSISGVYLPLAGGTLTGATGITNQAFTATGANGYILSSSSISTTGGVFGHGDALTWGGTATTLNAQLTAVAASTASLQTVKASSGTDNSLTRAQALVIVDSTVLFKSSITTQGDTTSQVACAGCVGEQISTTPAGAISPAASGTGISIATTTATPGHWRIDANVGLSVGGTFAGTGYQCGVSYTANSGAVFASGDGAAYNGAHYDLQRALPTIYLDTTINKAVFIVCYLDYTTLGGSTWSSGETKLTLTRYR